VLLDDHPAYRRAKEWGIAIEERARAAPFRELKETICGIPVVPLTLRIIRRLKEARSPFLVGGHVTPGALVAFIWAVSPDYKLGTTAPDALIEQVRALPFTRVRREIRRMVFYAWMDRPPVSRKNGSSAPPAVAFEVAMIHHIAKAYHWDGEKIRNIDLRVLHQFLTMIRIDGDSKAVTFNPIVSRLTKRVLKNLVTPDTERAADR
jgi:hypothetical protein